jgi:hypothetical protein
MSNRFLEEYQLAADWAVVHDVHQRTVDRYRQQPDGLPFLNSRQDLHPEKSSRGLDSGAHPVAEPSSAWSPA